GSAVESRSGGGGADEALRAGSEPLAVRAVPSRADPSHVERGGEARDRRQAERRPDATRRRQLHGYGDRRNRQPDFRRIVEDRRRSRRLGSIGGAQQPRAVGRPRQPALSRPVRALVARQVLPDLLLSPEGGIGG